VDPVEGPLRLEDVSTDELVADLVLNDEPGADAGRDAAPHSSPNHPLDPPPASRPASVAEEIVANLNASAR
jgi:hypothetical protein